MIKQFVEILEQWDEHTKQLKQIAANKKRTATLQMKRPGPRVSGVGDAMWGDWHPAGSVVQQGILRPRRVLSVAAYDLAMLKVPRGGIIPHDAKGFVGSIASRFLEHADDLIVLGDGAVLPMPAPPGPHRDLVLPRDFRAKNAFVETLNQVGFDRLLQAGAVPHRRLSVRKTGDQIRLVLETRPANELYQPPPKGSLGTLGTLCAAQPRGAAISREALRRTVGSVVADGARAIPMGDAVGAFIDVQAVSNQVIVSEGRRTRRACRRPDATKPGKRWMSPPARTCGCVLPGYP